MVIKMNTNDAKIEMNKFLEDNVVHEKSNSAISTSEANMTLREEF